MATSRSHKTTKGNDMGVSRQVRTTTRATSGARFQHLTTLVSPREILLSANVTGKSFQLTTAIIVLIGLLAVAWLVYHTGGTQYAFPYLILLPVILAAAVFKVPGGLLSALVAALLLGPYMPLNSATGQMQTTQNWLIRLILYLSIGGFAGALATALDAARRRALAMVQFDTASGLISSTTARHLVASDVELSFVPTHTVAIGFDGYDNISLGLGMDAGKEIVRQLGRYLSDLCGDEALITRIHGATFCAIVPGKDEHVRAFVERCHKEMPRNIDVEGILVPTLPRFGIATLGHAERRNSSLFRMALVALRAAQDSGQFIAHLQGASESDSRDNVHLLGEFRRDLEDGLCEVHLQPKYDLASDRVYGAEALIRWTSATRGPVSPSRFVPLVENTLLIDSMTRFVIARSAQILADWRRQGIDFCISINLAMPNLEDDALVDFLIRTPAQHGVPATSIELELTETALMRRLEVARHALKRLRDAGFIISVDDFGTGYSSLRYLKELPIDWVKLDQSFVRDLPDDAASREISAATAVMCKRLGLRTIAEGVENAQTVEYLRDQGYNAVQGFHIAKPMAADAFQAWLGFLPDGTRGSATSPIHA